MPEDGRDDRKETGGPADSWLAKALAALKANQPEAVVDAARRALGHDPDSVQAYWLWAVAAIDLRRHAEAEVALAQAARRVADDDVVKVRFLAQRTQSLSLMGWTGEARRTARAALKLVETHPAMADGDALYFLGTSLMLSGDEAGALPVMRRAGRLDPQNATIWTALGEAAEYMGFAGEAEAAFETAIAIGQSTGAHLALARLRRWTPQRNHIQRLEALSANTPLDAARRAYALFKEYDDLGQVEAAWRWLQTGAEAARQEAVQPFNPAWSVDEERAQVAAWTSAFPKARFISVAPPSGPPKRIFVVGMPRSGTTLVERILNAHSQVQGLGEWQAFPGAVKALSGTDGPDILTPDVVSAIGHVDPLRLAPCYDLDLGSIGDGRCTVDKLPRNADYAGLIRLAFPEARIVHVRRDPMDTLFGAYRLHLAARWSYDLNDLADRYACHRALMAHWTDCLGDGLIDVSLEAIIVDPKAQIRRLLDLCGLPFEDACLSPHESLGAVASASSSQVRRPINADGVGAWRRYESQLAPLHRRLSDMGLLD